MSGMAISLAWAVVAVVPLDAAVLLPAPVAVTSSGAADAPVTSRTVNASAEALVTVTVTCPGVVMEAALAAYQISPSACPPWLIFAALTHTLPAES